MTTGLRSCDMNAIGDACTFAMKRTGRHSILKQ